MDLQIMLLVISATLSLISASLAWQSMRLAAKARRLSERAKRLAAQVGHQSGTNASVPHFGCGTNISFQPDAASRLATTDT